MSKCGYGAALAFLNRCINHNLLWKICPNQPNEESGNKVHSPHMKSFFQSQMQFLQKHQWFRVLRNRYVLVSVAFVIWMFFLDTNSVLIQWELKQELKQLEADKKFFQKEIEANKAALEALTGSDESLEKYARENHLMVREGEEVFIVEE